MKHIACLCFAFLLQNGESVEWQSINQRED